MFYLYYCLYPLSSLEFRHIMTKFLSHFVILCYNFVMLLGYGSVMRREYMPPLSRTALRRLIGAGETGTVELKVASPRPDEMAERLCGLANAHGGYIIIGVADESLAIVGVSERKIALTKDVILRAARQIIK